MAKLSRRGRLWLRAFHIFFLGLWIGGIACTLVMFLLTGIANNDEELKLMYLITRILYIPGGVGMLGTIITGIVLARRTPWGFFKHRWLIYKQAIYILYLVDVVVGNVVFDKATAIVQSEGLAALQNPAYTDAWTGLIITSVLNLLILISIVFVSEIKPWRKHTGAEEAA
jgi:uncharacterized integral membrane protein